MLRITPFLWFDDNAEEAIDFYTSVFKNSKIVSITRHGEAGLGPKGAVMSATFQLQDQELMALNGGPQFKFTEAISFFVNCETQQEVDELWEKLSEGGEKGRCGWLKDKFGLSWQIVPSALGEMLSDKDAEKSRRVMEAMLQMDRIDIKTLRQAYEQELNNPLSAWHSEFGSSLYDDEVTDLALDGSGNVYVTGQSRIDGSGLDWVTIKYSADGAQQWFARYDGPDGGDDFADAVAVDGSGNVYVALPGQMASH
jgi:predicted 3-demethylubiquinone-9 3-methyltransferase (glyoxalase superfamily)